MKKKIGVIIIAFLLIISITGFSYAVPDNDLEQKRIELKQKIEKAGKNLENISVELTENLEEISKLDSSITEYEEKVETISTKLEQIQARITETEKALEKTQKKYERRKKILEKRLMSVYEAGSTTYLDVLLNSKSIVEFITNYYIIGEIAQYDANLLEGFEKEKQQIVDIENELLTAKEDLKALKNEQKKVLVSLENAKMIRKSYVDNLTAEEIKIKDEIDVYQTELDLMDLEILMASLENNGSDRYVGGAFAWPAPGYYTITSPYGMRTHPILKTYRNHTGMDIGAPMGSYAIAANDGVVTKSTYSYSYGNMVMVDHGGGVVTLYAHGSELLVNVGDVVKRGDPVLKVGSTGWSTGPHLHFEIRINGQTIDPYPYVVSSTLNNTNSQ